MRLTKMTLAIAFVAIAFASCKDQKEAPVTEETTTTEVVEEVAAPAVDTKVLVGSWTQPNPINDKEVQGFELKEDGTAASINRATLQTKKWWVEGDKLFLEQESIGNGTSSIDTVSYPFEVVDGNTLNLLNGESKDSFTRK
ncbi:lipocalin family protein [Myroides odoratus]|uniref:lipocalin family protein n=1 Tax=Myroides odoratus TaxID=256 RepID=UPI00076603F9|nr:MULTISPECIES: lipocalin family protein [Myroides]WHT37686.1 lipocalin family protein [Myroides sp. mNGS23_01]